MEAQLGSSGGTLSLSCGGPGGWPQHKPGQGSARVANARAAVKWLSVRGRGRDGSSEELSLGQGSAGQLEGSWQEDSALKSGLCAFMALDKCCFHPKSVPYSCLTC